MRLSGSLRAVVMTVLAAGCSKEPTGKTPTLDGRYTLEVIVGKSLPMVTYSATLSQAKLEVLDAELVPVSRSRMLDIVEYQATTETGVRQAPYKDAVAVTYVRDGSTITITRPRGNAEPSVEVWEVTEGGISGDQWFKGVFGMLVGPYATFYTLVQ